MALYTEHNPYINLAITSAYGNQHPHSLLSRGVTPTASHQHLAPEPPGQREGQGEGESGQELFSPMQLASQCNIWDSPLLCCLSICDSPVRNSPYSPLLSAPLLVFCPSVLSLCSCQAETQTHRKCNMGYFPMGTGIVCEAVPRPFEPSCSSWLPID